MTSILLQQWMRRPEAMDRDSLYELRMLINRYPYFQSARLLYLKNLSQLKDESFGEELRRAAPFVADRRQLFRLIEDGPQTACWAGEVSASAVSEGEEPGMDRTLSLIDAFLAQSPEKTSSGQPVGLDYTMDYTAYLLQEGEDGAGAQSAGSVTVPPLRGQELIDDFIREQEEAPVELPQAPLPDALVPETPVAKGPDLAGENELDESCFTETLAKIYIKQHRYEKALEIIKKLSLNYPKKNAYFADQIRFLEKLIINANSK